MSIKFHEDQYFNNEFYSSVGGICCEEMNKLEAEMLVLLDFDLAIVPSAFSRYVAAMEEYYEQLMSPHRGKAHDVDDQKSLWRIMRAEKGEQGLEERV